MKVLMVIAILLQSLVAETALAAFGDVTPTHANYDAILFIQSRGIVQGYPDGSFRPDRTINRAEFVKILIMAVRETSFDCPEDSIPRLFLDVPLQSWYAPYVCFAQEHGLVEGYSDQRFHGERTINFAEAAKILSRTFSLPRIPGEVWYEEYIRSLGAVQAIPLSVTSFDHKITRGEMAEMIWRLDQKITDHLSRTYLDLGGLQKNDEEKVYLYFTDSRKWLYDQDCGAVRSVARSKPKTLAIADATLRLLFMGATEQEQSNGFKSDQFFIAYNEDGILLEQSLGDLYERVTIVDGVVTLYFKEAARQYFFQGLCGMSTVIVPIERTLRALPALQSLKSIQYSIGGKIVTDFGY